MGLILIFSTATKTLSYSYLIYRKILCITILHMIENSSCFAG
jgi:hypothetical protein